MNPTFTVSIDTEKRKASAAGLVAVGEKVDVVVTGLDVTQIPEWEQDNDEGFSGPSLRFRLVAPDGKDLVRFPLAEGDAWTIGAEGELTAEVDFNTMPLRHWFHGYEIGAKAEVGIILDSIVDAMEYGRGTVKVLQWTASPAEDPTILPDWRKTLRDLNAAIVEIKDSVDLAEGYANNAEASAGVATEKAGVAVTAANNALSSKSAAEGFKDAAQTAAGTATAKAEEAAESADTATTKAEEAASSAGNAAQILKDIEEAIAGKAEQSDLEAEVMRATQKEEELENGLTAANDAISDNADAIGQLEESKANKTAIDALSDAIDSEAETREEKDAAICAKLNQEIGNRQAADNTLSAAIATKADKATTYTKTEVDTKIAGVQTFKKYLVQTLPDADEADMKGLYLVPTGETSEEGDLCEEWTVIEEDGEKRWEKIGGTVVDLDNYYTKSEVNGKLDEKQAKLYTQGQPGWTFSTESTGTEIEAFMANAANYSVTEEQAGSAWLYTLTGYDEENYYVAPVGRTAQSTSIPFYVFDVTQTSMYGSVLAEYSSAQTDVPAQIDTTPTANSGRLVTSGGIWSAIWGALSALPTGFSSLYDWCVAQLAGKASKAEAEALRNGKADETTPVRHPPYIADEYFPITCERRGAEVTYTQSDVRIVTNTHAGTYELRTADSANLAIAYFGSSGAFNVEGSGVNNLMFAGQSPFYVTVTLTPTGGTVVRSAEFTDALGKKVDIANAEVDHKLLVYGDVDDYHKGYPVEIIADHKDGVVTPTIVSDDGHTSKRYTFPVPDWQNGQIVLNGNLALLQNIADGFKASTTYAKDALVVYEGALYRCVNAEGHKGSWLDADFSRATAEDVLAALRAALKGKADKPATFTEGHLAALTADGNPTDSGVTASECLRYDLGTAQTISTASQDTSDTETIDYGAATMADRTGNYVAITTALDELRVTFPAATNGKIRDFLLRVEVGTGSAALTAPALVCVAPTGENITLENPDGSMPAIAAGTATAKGVAVFYFSETAAGKFICKGMEMKEVA